MAKRAHGRTGVRSSTFLAHERSSRLQRVTVLPCGFAFDGTFASVYCRRLPEHWKCNMDAEPVLSVPQLVGVYTYRPSTLSISYQHDTADLVISRLTAQLVCSAPRQIYTDNHALSDSASDTHPVLLVGCSPHPRFRIVVSSGTRADHRGPR